MTSTLANWFDWPTSPADQPTASEDEILTECAALRACGDSEAALIKTLAFHPDRHESFPHLLAVCESALAAGRYETAKNAAALMLLKTEFAGGWHILALSQVKAGEINDAIDSCHCAIERHPRSGLPWLTLATIYAEADPDMSFEMFKKSVEVFSATANGSDDERKKKTDAVVREVMTLNGLAPIKDRIAAFHFLHFDQPQN